MKKLHYAGIFSMAALLAATPLLAPRAAAAHANSAAPYWEGKGASGIVVKEGECPVVVNHEALTLKVPDYGNTASVTAEYVFYNPSDLDVKMTLLFPFGTVGDTVGYEDLDEYSITADGEEVGRNIRYTYATYGMDDSGTFINTVLYGDGDYTERERFDAQTDMKRVRDDYDESGFFRRDLPYAEYVYTVSLSKREKGYDYYAVVNFPSLNPNKTLVQSGHAKAVVRNGRGSLRYYIRTEDEMTFSFALFGEVTPYSVSFVRADRNTGTETVISGTFRKQSEKTTTFGEYVQASKPTGYGPVEALSDVDWYNAVIDGYREPEPIAGIGYFTQPHLYSLMRWYEYELEIPAGGTLVNAVFAPVYYAMRNGTNAHAYTYYLSPALSWKEFGTIDITIETPLNLWGSTLDFQKVQGGYRYSAQTLPLCELRVVLSPDELGAVPRYGGDILSIDTIATVVLVIAVIGGIGFVVTAIVLSVYVSGKKKRTPSVYTGQTTPNGFDYTAPPQPYAPPAAPQPTERTAEEEGANNPQEKKEE